MVDTPKRKFSGPVCSIPKRPRTNTETPVPSRGHSEPFLPSSAPTNDDSSNVTSGQSLQSSLASLPNQSHAQSDPTSHTRLGTQLLAAVRDLAPTVVPNGTFTFTQVSAAPLAPSMDQADIPGSDLPRIGHVQLICVLDEIAKVYRGKNLLDDSTVLVRRLDRPRHTQRLRLANRISEILTDYGEHKKILDLIFPSSTTFVVQKEKSELYFYWIEPPNFGSLHAYVVEKKRLSEVQAKSYFGQICEIVQFLHLHGVIIRDLKLRKFVFADPDRLRVKLEDIDDVAVCPENFRDPDFIDSEIFDTNDDMLSQRHGCPAYVSPEILDLKQKWYSGKMADMWSLGVLQYVLLLGRYPFFDTEPAKLFQKIREGRFLLSAADKISLEAKCLIRALLQTDPARRLTVNEVLAHPWLKSRDHGRNFKNFDPSQLMFPRMTGMRSTSRVPAGQAGPSADNAAVVPRSNQIPNPSTVGVKIVERNRRMD